MTWMFKLRSGTDHIDVTDLVLNTTVNQTINTEGIHETLFSAGLLVNPDKQFLIVSKQGKSDWREVSFRLSWYFQIDLKHSLITRPDITVVYYVNSYVNSRYWILCYFQLLALKKSALIDQKEVTLQLVFAGDLVEQVKFAARVKALFSNYTNVVISCTEDNAFEYPGICKVKEVSEKNPNGYVLYFHPKGLSYLQLGWLKKHRLRTERVIFKHVIQRWRQNVAVLNHVRSVNKLGIQAGGKGWIWYNFWWVRSSYVIELEDPIITNDRYYYESWLVRKKKPDTPTADITPIENVPDCFGDSFSTFSALEYDLPNLGQLYRPDSFENKLAFYTPWKKLYKDVLRHFS